MMRIQSNQAFTLVEIIIASAVVSIIMIGIMTSNVSLQKSTNDAHNTFYVAASTQDMLDLILKDASLAMRKDSANPGVVINAGSNSFCFDQYDPGNTSLPEQWVCYTWSSYNLYRCVRSTAGSCSGSATWVGKSKNPMSLASNPNFTLSSTQGGQQKVLFEITLESCLDPSNVSCCDPSVCGTADNSNPYVKKYGSVSPPGISAR